MPQVLVPIQSGNYVIVLDPLAYGLIFVAFVIGCMVCFTEWHDIFNPTEKKKEGK